MKLSIIIPLLNEARSLRQILFEIDSMLQKNNYSAEVIFVDDGSRDNSWEVITELAGVNEHVKGIRLRRNFGKSIALKAGLEASSGELIQFLDADLQHNPKDIPSFIQKIEEGYDLVNGWQQNRQAHLFKIISSRFFNWLLRTIANIDLHDMNCGMKCFRHSSPYEASIRVPYIFWNKNLIPQPTSVTGFRQQTDIAPTIIDLLGLKIAEGELYGVSLREPADKRINYAACRFDQCLIRMSWPDKFVYYYDNQPPELYNIREDPGESNNLVDTLPLDFKRLCCITPISRQSFPLPRRYTVTA